MRDGSLEVSDNWQYVGDIRGYPRTQDPLPTKKMRALMEKIEDRQVEPVIKIFPGNIFITGDDENQMMALAVRWLRMSYIRVEVVVPKTEEELYAYKRIVGRNYDPANLPPPRRFREEERF